MPSRADCDHRSRRGRDDVEREAMLVGAGVEALDEALDVLLQSHLLPRLDQMLPADAPELRIVAEEVRELCSLLYEVNLREARDLLAQSSTLRSAR